MKDPRLGRAANLENRIINLEEKKIKKNNYATKRKT